MLKIISFQTCPIHKYGLNRITNFTKSRLLIKLLEPLANIGIRLRFSNSVQTYLASEH